MSPRRTDPWRLGAVCLFLGLPLGLAGATFANLAAVVQATDAAERKAEPLARITAELATRKTQARAPRDTGPIYLSITSESLARAEIQALLTRLVATASGRLIETQGITEAEGEAGPKPGGRGRVALQLTLDIANAGLLDVLHAIETGLPLLTVRALDVRRGPRGDAPTGADSLRITLVVEGFWRSRAA